MQEGIRLYFKEYQFKTTVLQNFIDCLKLALAKNMKDLELQ
jgi:hypothetical protein